MKLLLRWKVKMNHLKRLNRRNKLLMILKKRRKKRNLHSWEAFLDLKNLKKKKKRLLKKMTHLKLSLKNNLQCNPKLCHSK